MVFVDTEENTDQIKHVTLNSLLNTILINSTLNKKNSFVQK